VCFLGLAALQPACFVCGASFVLTLPKDHNANQSCGFGQGCAFSHPGELAHRLHSMCVRLVLLLLPLLEL
jgi:hypothetical protein